MFFFVACTPSCYIEMPPLLLAFLPLPLCDSQMSITPPFRCRLMLRHDA